jgi:CheY-like chemotaxis protein
MNGNEIKSLPNKGTLLPENTEVLLVDDGQVNRTLLKSMLTRIGFKEELITEAENGEEAVLLFKNKQNSRKKYELIITDLEMPKLNGLQLSQQIRQEEDKIARCKGKDSTKRKIIMLNSGNAIDTEEFLLECSRAKITAIFPKPYIFAEIKRLMSRYFQLPQ